MEACLKMNERGQVANLLMANKNTLLEEKKEKKTVHTRPESKLKWSEGQKRKEVAGEELGKEDGGEIWEL